MGDHHQATSAASTIEPISAHTAASEKRATNQRRRPTPWVSASLSVPLSNSRPTSGAPQKTPMSTGSAVLSVPRSSRAPVLSYIRREARGESQSPSQPLHTAMSWADMNAVMSARRYATQAAHTARTTAPIRTNTRCWRQASHRVPFTPLPPDRSRPCAGRRATNLRGRAFRRSIRRRAAARRSVRAR